ncbi:hypothetical protein [Bernardetia sp.]|uniref:hypothetical protein n=1 Tax=Bernardetia sp. TaxID=1937974 RepID=UPI0025BBC27E|nr:hypothetical protein [Bernardetia sp.]
MKKNKQKKVEKKRKKLAKKIDRKLDYEFEFLGMRINDLMRNSTQEVIEHPKIQNKMSFLHLCAMIFNEEKLKDFLDMPEWEEKVKERKQLLTVIGKIRNELKDIEDKLYKSMIDKGSEL